MNQKYCWNSNEIDPTECPIFEERRTSKQQRRLEECGECSCFARDLKLMHEEDNPLAPLLSDLLNENNRQKTQIQSLVSFLDNKTLEMRFLHELGSVLQSSVDLEEVLSVALTAITAGKGFGYYGLC